MADIEEASTPMEAVNDSADSDSSSDEQPEPQVEWLATSRAKRSTAGTRMTSLIQQEAEDDELELLFAEDENDEGFEMEGGDDSDVQMDSSDDDDDNGPPAPGAEELDGEKELLRKERAERMGKKRKNDHLPKSFQAKRAKVQMDATIPPARERPPRPKKKSERSSWIPTPDEAPVRVSHRSTTMQAKVELYEEMERREEQRLKQLETMEKAAARKAAEKKPKKTQEDRLAEAARIEKANAKSLNRWEEAERIREEEARARLEALHNRKMEGPVITWWSGKATYVGEQLKQVGKSVEVAPPPPPKVPRKKRPSEMGLGDSATAKARLERQQSLPKTNMGANGKQSAPSSGPGTPLASGFTSGPAVQGQPPQNSQPPVQPIQATPAMLNGSTPLSGLSAPPSAPASPFPQPVLTPSGPSPSPAAAPQLPPPPPPTPAVSVTLAPPNGNKAAPANSLPFTMAPSTATSQPTPQLQPQPHQVASSINRPTNTAVQNSPPTIPSPAAQPSAGPMPPPQNFSNGAVPTNGPSPSPLNLTPNAPQPNSPLPAQQIKSEPPPSMPPPSIHKQFLPQQNSQFAMPPQHNNIHTSNSAPPAPTPPQPVSYATSNRVILSSFHEPALRDKSTLSAILFRGNRFNRLPKPTAPPVCAITGLPAKFRDPKTGLPYVNSYAFKEIKRLERGEYRWSKLLGAYVGGVDRLTAPSPGAAPVTVPGAARGVPGRFTDPKAPAPPKVVKQEAKPTTPGMGMNAGAMAPPPLPQNLPGTPTPNGMGGPQPIMTPGQFAAQNPINRMPPSPQTQNTSQTPKQPSPSTAAALNRKPSPNMPAANKQVPAPNKQTSGTPFTMQASPSAQPMAQSITSPIISKPAVPAPPPPTPVADVAATVAAVAPLVAPVTPIAAPMGAVPPTAPAQPKA